VPDWSDLPNVSVLAAPLYLLLIAGEVWWVRRDRTRDGLHPFLMAPGASVLWDTTTPLGSGYDAEGREH
jgi:hypothetical protein